MERIGEFLPFMLEGSVTTVQVFAITLVLSLPLGLPLALGSNSRFKPLSFLCKVYIWIFRGTPLMLQLWFFYFFFPFYFNIRMDAFTTAAITFVLNYASYFAEIYRGGINSIDKGQYEAAKALGMSVLGLTLAANESGAPAVSHESVHEAAEGHAQDFEALVRGVLHLL